MGELSSATSTDASNESGIEDLIRSRYLDWVSSKTIWRAADLLSSAFVANKANAFVEVAQFILETADKAPKSLVSLAQRIVSPYSEISNDALAVSTEKTWEEIHTLRARLIEEPRNSIVWSDLSRLYVALGLSEKSAHAMQIAVSLSPSNRFILRSASRLFLHLDQPRKALELLRRDSNITLGDPWLAAAEISVASAAKMPSRYAKKAFKMADDDGFSDFSRTELRSALATLELDSGKNRNAKQLFRQSLVSPNENSLAQYEWAERYLGGVQVPRQPKEPPRSFEAQGYHAYNRQNWQIALDNGLKWMQDESYSTRPAMFTSYLASAVLEEYEIAERVLCRALSANFGNPQILNNLAFALINLGKLDEAQKALNEVDYSQVNELYLTTLAATQGLLLIRQGDFERGRFLYKEAYSRASALNANRYKQLASIYLAREELLANTSEANAAIREAQKEVGENPDPDVALVFNRVLELNKARQPRQSVSGG